MVELLKGMSQFDMVNITMRKVIENRNLVSGLDQITKENQVPIDYDDKNDDYDHDGKMIILVIMMMKVTIKKHSNAMTFLVEINPLKFFYLVTKRPYLTMQGLTPHPPNPRNVHLIFLYRCLL